MISNLRIYFIFSLFITTQTYSQTEEKVLFSKAIDRNIQAFNRKSENAFFNNDIERVNFLFDSLVNHVIKGTHLDNFIIHRRSGRQTRIHTYEKPLFLITYSAWYPLGEGEIQAFNQIAKEHHKEIDFIALFWEPKQITRRISRSFSRKVNVIYVDEQDNLSDNIVRSMKHSLGVPTAIFTDSEKIILDVGRLPAHNFNKSTEVSYASKYVYFLQGVTTILTAQTKGDQNIIYNIPFQEYR